MTSGAQQRETPRPNAAALPLAVRGQLFSQLAAMETAGLPFDRAINLLKLPATAQARVTGMRRLTTIGLGIANAGQRSGLFTEWEAGLLAAALSAGSPAHMYHRLADHYNQRALQLKQIKSRMILPAATLILAILLSSLPKLVAGDITTDQYLWSCTRSLLLLGLAAWLVFAPPAWLGKRAAASTDARADRFIAALPLIGNMYQRRSTRDFFESLALLLEAGMPMLQALPKAIATIQNLAVRSEFAKLEPAVQSGANLTLALGTLKFVGRDLACSMAATGEGSGALPEMLLRYADGEAEAIRSFDEQLTAWAPRIVYMALNLYIGYTIVQSGAFMPQMPDELK